MTILRKKPLLTTATVETDLGRLIGYVDRACCFRGVPYATVRRRFDAPCPVEPWGERRAVTPSPASPQPAVKGIGMRGATITSEDCLHLHIFTPACDGQRRPVLVWIFGGGYMNGDAGDALFDGQTLALNEDVVVVSINYRLGPLGFLDHLASNAGHRDQLAALEWIQAHIHHFGGDAANVTLFGESAGGMSICNLLTMDAARGLFHRAIVQSGDGDNVASAEQARMTAQRFGSLTPLDAPIEQILDAQIQTLADLYPAFRRPAFRPWIDHDLLDGLPEANAARGAGIALIMGFNADEQRLYVSPLKRIRDADLARQIEARLQTRCASPESAAKRIIELYRATLADDNRNAAILAAVQTELNFRQPMLRYARARGVNTWLYRFNWRSPALRGWLKACHAIEIPFVFGNFGARSTRKFVGAGAELLSRQVQSLWADFAREGRSTTLWPQSPAIMDIHPGIARAQVSPADALWNELLP